jgi:hypothetical protein
MNITAKRYTLSQTNTVQIIPNKQALCGNVHAAPHGKSQWNTPYAGRSALQDFGNKDLHVGTIVDHPCFQGVTRTNTARSTT